MQLIEAEQQQQQQAKPDEQKPTEQQPEQTVSEIKPEQPATRKEEPSPPPPPPLPPPPPPVSETKPPTEIRIDKIDDNHVLLRLALTSDDLDRSSFLDTLNSSLKRLAVTLDRFVDEQTTTTSDVYFLVKEIASGGEQPLGASESVKLETYDFLVEVNGQPVGYQNNVSQISLATADKHLSLKFRNDPSFKLQVT